MLKVFFQKELLLAARRFHELLQPIIFLLILITLFPIAIGSDPKLLTKLAPAIIWIGVLLSILLSGEKFYKNDYEDGSLEQFYLSGNSLILAVYAKLIIQWLTLVFPIILITPILGIFYQLELGSIAIIMVTLLLATPSLLLFAMLGSAVTLSISRGGLLLILVILPFYIPTLIFAVSAIKSYNSGFAFSGELLILSAILMLSLTLLPFAIIATIKASLAEG